MIRAAVSSRPPASPSPLPAEGWLVIDRLGGGVAERREASPGEGRRTTEWAPLAHLKRTPLPHPPSRRWRSSGFRNVGDLAVARPDCGKSPGGAPGGRVPGAAGSPPPLRPPRPEPPGRA